MVKNEKQMKEIKTIDQLAIFLKYQQTNRECRLEALQPIYTTND